MDTGWMTSAEVKELYHMNPDKWSGLFVEEIVTRLLKDRINQILAWREHSYKWLCYYKDEEDWGMVNIYKSEVRSLSLALDVLRGVKGQLLADPLSYVPEGYEDIKYGEPWEAGIGLVRGIDETTHP